ncbi:hypothetical protein BD311DRAFT_763095 [Dichomitus squalens]|uniref:Uncharacterized protein n=1 Tax=Dichomitus squalens TaxID=114155 RepID=A0A4Q9MHA1_9APHY|nr:hypothetical protein BD311DRAFT_763095 [Dichomitus squalens]
MPYATRFIHGTIPQNTSIVTFIRSESPKQLEPYHVPLARNELPYYRSNSPLAKLDSKLISRRLSQGPQCLRNCLAAASWADSC